MTMMEKEVLSLPKSLEHTQLVLAVGKASVDQESTLVLESMAGQGTQLAASIRAIMAFSVETKS